MISPCGIYLKLTNFPVNSLRLPLRGHLCCDSSLPTFELGRNKQLWWRSRYGLTWSMIWSLLKESANRFPCDNTLRRSLNLVIIDKRDGVADMGMPRAWFDCFVKNLRLARYTPLVEVNQANKSLACRPFVEGRRSHRQATNFLSVDVFSG